MSDSGDLSVLLIRPSKGWVPFRLKELWNYRELLYFLVWRDVKVRYKQTALGAAWAILQPLLTMIVFSVFFGRLAKIPSDGIPYPVFAYCGLLPWQFFSNALTESSNSLVGNQNLVTKVYFPRLVIPVAAISAGFVDFSIAFLVLLGMMAFYGIVPTLAIFLLPFFLLLAFVTALGAGLWLSALNVKYRDVRYTIPFLTQFWFFMTPIVYPSSLLRGDWQAVYGLNPMAGVVEGFRWVLLGNEKILGGLIALSIGMAVSLLVSGLYYFGRAEQTFADLI